MKFILLFLLLSIPCNVYSSAPPSPPPPPGNMAAVNYPKWFEQDYLSKVDKSKHSDLKSIYNRMMREKKSEDEIKAELDKKLAQFAASSVSSAENKPKIKPKPSGGTGSFDSKDIEKKAAEREARVKAEEEKRLKDAQPYFAVSRDLVVVAFSVAPQSFMPVQKIVQSADNKKPIAQASVKYPVWMLKKPYVSPANPQEIQGKLKKIFDDPAHKNKSENELRALFDKALSLTVSVSSASSGGATPPQEELKSKLPQRVE